MTPLTETQIRRFWNLHDNGDYEETIDYGLSLMAMDTHDGAGIRMGIMDAYAILGMTDVAETFIKDFLARNHGARNWAGFRNKEREAEDPYYWMNDMDIGTTYQLAMCYWKAGKLEPCKRLLNCCFALDQFVNLNKRQIKEIEARNKARGFVVGGTLEMTVDMVCIPIAFRREFDNWIKKEVLPNWTDPFPRKR